MLEKRESSEPSATVHGAAKSKWTIPLAALLALLLIYAGFCAAAVVRRTIAPRTRVGQTDVGGLTIRQASERLSGGLDTLRRASGVRVVLTEGAEVAYLSYRSMNAHFDAEALAKNAYQSSHSGNLAVDGWRLLRAVLGGRTNITPTPIAGWTTGAAQRLAEAASLPPRDFSYAIEDGQLFLTRERDGRGVDVRTLRARLNEAEADENGTRTVKLPYVAIPAKTADFDAVSAELAAEMTNASYDKETQRILPGRPAARFDIAAARSVLDAAAPGETVSVPVTFSDPEITEAKLRRMLFRDVLGTYTTKVSGSAGRKSNVRLTAERVNGAVLNSGEEFDYYALTGPFSADNGYQRAPGYLRGKSVEMAGGGACQCSSTVYAASLLANLEIVSRAAHGFASDYIGLGLDATVSGGGPDFIFRNNTPYPIRVDVVYTKNNRLTVTIVGTKTDDTTVKMRTEVISTTPYKEDVVVDRRLAPGARVVETTPYTGYLVNTYRQIYDGEGNLLSEAFEARSKYNKRNRVVRVGPAAPAAAPVELPVETPSDADAPA